jgi:uncharacterized protein YukE
MRSAWLPWQRRWQRQIAEDQEKLGNAQRQLADSERRLSDTERDVMEPLREMRDRDNVSALIRGLLERS